MRALTRSRILVLLSVCLVASACDLFNSNDEATPTDPSALFANAVLFGEVNMTAGDNGNAVFLGEVINTGGVTAQNVRVSVNIRDGAGTLIDVATASTVPVNVASNAIATFRIESNTPTAQVVTRQFVIEWD